MDLLALAWPTDNIKKCRSASRLKIPLEISLRIVILRFKLLYAYCNSVGIMIDPSPPEPSGQFNTDFRPPGTVGQQFGGRSDRFHPVLQDRWEILEHLGQGGMGTVYKARDRRLANRLCVVKKLRVDLFRQEEREQALEFFDREASMLSTLKHPNIVRIYDRFRENENYYLVMEYVEGENLEQMLVARGEPFSEEQVTEWAVTICEVLHYLHSRRPPVIYRDLKPSNIMLDAVDGIKLVDFGIARPYREDGENTHVVSGGYSPPEQYWGGADTRSDIYALGATMYFLLTGSEPIALKTSSPKKINPKLSAKIDSIVQKATSQYVELRYQYACAMREELEAPVKAPGRRISSNFLSAVWVIALVSALAATLTFLGTTGRQFISTFKNTSAVNGRGETEGMGALSQSKAVKGFTQASRIPLVPESPKAEKVEPKIASVATLMQIKAQSSEPKIRSYPLDLAVPETREEMLTDPEGLKPLENETDKAAEGMP
jgi:serine/threonine protein kinase